MSSPPQTSPPAPAAPRVRLVCDLRKGDKITGTVLLVEASNFKQTRNQKYFIQMSLRDRTGSIKAIRWEATPELYASFAVDDFVRVNGRVEEFQQQLQLIVDGLERVLPESVDFSHFLPVSNRPPAEMERELHAGIAEVQDPHLRALLRTIVEDPEIRPGLLRCPAGKSLHHAYVGGLLEHILSLMGAVRMISQIYPQLNRDLLLASTVLHDIGKVHELSYTRNFSYTDSGQLLGHIALGLLLVAEKARAIPGFPKDLLLQIEHVIISHHGQPEHGALKPPMTPEAIAFHYLDNLDAKLGTLSSMEKELDLFGNGQESDAELPAQRPPEGGRWTDFKPHLGRKIFFPRWES
jgi:3'-5' exoribonuclease